MNFIIDSKVTDLGLKVKSVIIENIDNSKYDDEFYNWRLNEVAKLIAKYQDYDIKEDEVIEGFYKIHQLVGVPRRKNLPASENLIRLLMKRQELIEINKAVDIYNLISIDSKLCLGAHDIDKINGNVTLKITDGTEKFIPLGSNELKEVKPGEYSFVDDEGDIICYLDIRQVDKTKVTVDSKNIIYFIIGNDKNTDEELEKTALNLISLTTKFCKGSGRIL